MDKTIDILADIERAKEHKEGINGVTANPHPGGMWGNHCPFCGYDSEIWLINDFGWAECPICGAT